MVVITACWIGNKAAKEFYFQYNNARKLLPKFNEEKSCFLTQFFPSMRYFLITLNTLFCLLLLTFKTNIPLV